MKKLLLLFILTFSLISSKAQDTTSLTVREVYTDIKSGFTQLVTTLEGPAKHTYLVYVNQYRNEGIISLIGTTLILLLTFLLITLNVAKGITENFNKNSFFFIIGIICLIVSIVASLDFFSYNMAKLLNPEYYAIDKIITSFIK